VSLFQDEFELSGRVADWYAGLDSRTMLGTLTNVKYFIVKDRHEKFLPYGYDKNVGSDTAFDGKYNVYENRFALPFGYTYSSYIPRETYKKFSSIQKQQAIMQGAVIDEEISAEFNLLKDIIFREKKVKSFFSKSGDGKIYLSKKLNINFPFPKNFKGEIYIRFDNIAYLRDIVSAYIYLDNEYKKCIFLPTRKYAGVLENNNYIANISYLKNNNIDIIIKSKMGKFSVDGIEIISLPIGDDYEKETAALKQDHLKNVKELTNGISGTISLKENKILLLSIPYSKGWTAFVNGKKTKLLKSNTMFMALPLKAGGYEIELKYITPGLKLGILISLMGFMIFTVLIRRDLFLIKRRISKFSKYIKGYFVETFYRSKKIVEECH
jgi:uncharacterized membrane protein YfhO